MTNCAVCGKAASIIVELVMGDYLLGYVCEPCEEDFMVTLAETQPDGAEGLEKWRAAKEERKKLKEYRDAQG